MSNRALLLVVHLVGLLLWSSGILGGARVLAVRNGQASPPARAALADAARALGLLGDIGISLALVAGIGLLVEAPGYLRQPWMHMKLTLVLVALALHGVVRGRGARAARDPETSLPTFVVPALAAVMAGIVFLVVVQPLAR